MTYDVITSTPLHSQGACVTQRLTNVTSLCQCHMKRRASLRCMSGARVQSLQLSSRLKQRSLHERSSLRGVINESLGHIQSSKILGRDPVDPCLRCGSALTKLFHCEIKLFDISIMLSLDNYVELKLKGSQAEAATCASLFVLKFRGTCHQSKWLRGTW